MNDDLNFVLMNLTPETIEHYQESGLTVHEMAEKARKLTESGQKNKVNTFNLDKFHHKDEDTGRIKGVFDYAIFQYICDTENLFIMGGTPYIYKHGVYIPDENGAELKTKIRKLIYPQFIKSTTIKRIYELFLQSAELQASYKEVNQYPQYYINFLNGFFDPLTGETIPHNAKYKAINQIPHSYYPEKELKGDNIEKWFNFIFEDEAEREMILQYAGLSLTRDTRQQKFLVLLGEGGTGKSTLIRLLENAIGSENISNISLSELTQRFASFGLLGKLLNSCADLEIGALEDTSIIKKILGEDSLRAEQKGKDAVSFKNYSKLIFSTNELPTVRNERSNGFYRRLLVFTMNKVPKNKAADFFESLNSEIDYFIKLSVEALRRMYRAGYITEPNSSIKAVKQLREDSDTVEAFLNANPLKEAGARIERSTLYGSYEQYCCTSGRKVLSKTNFYKAMRSRGYQDRPINGYYYFFNISFNEEI